MDLSTLLGMLNQEIRTNALLPTGLSPNPPPGQRVGPPIPPTNVPLPPGLSPGLLPGQSIEPQAPPMATALPAGLRQTLPPGPRIDPKGPATIAASADVYHSSDTPTSPSLLTQSGVNAYVQLLNALSAAGHSEKSANLLTSTLLGASATLKSAYFQALAQLPAQLQAKDWRFSVSNGSLVFMQGEG